MPGVFACSIDQLPERGPPNDRSRELTARPLWRVCNSYTETLLGTLDNWHQVGANVRVRPAAFAQRTKFRI